MGCPVRQPKKNEVMIKNADACVFYLPKRAVKEVTGQL